MVELRRSGPEATSASAPAVLTEVMEKIVEAGRRVRAKKRPDPMWTSQRYRGTKRDPIEEIDTSRYRGQLGPGGDRNGRETGMSGGARSGLDRF